MEFNVPKLIYTHLHKIFSDLNDKVSAKISLAPNIPEESLDISFIDYLSNHSAPNVVSPGWAIRLATHFIGNIRYYRRYEVADIGVVIEFKRRTTVLRRKLVLLQSKRLYPNNYHVTELDDFDYELGLALITRQEPSEPTIFSTIEFEFDQSSSYGALRARSDQCKIIQEHFSDTGIPVYYMMYNPVVLPWRISYPRSDSQIDLPERNFGTRVISSTEIHKLLQTYSNNASLKVKDLVSNSRNEDTNYGLSLEDFFEEVIRCRQGYIYDAQNDAGLQRLFHRKSGPIYCIVEIVIENND